MKIFSYSLILLLASGIILSADISRCEDTYTDMTASVVVLPVFKLSLDNASINFGNVGPGKSVELYPNRNYNEVKCVSNKGLRWYLKVSILGEISAPANSKVAIDNFKWKIDRSDGDGTAEEGWRPFTKEPSRAYTSGTMDASGGEVTIKLRYKLDLPPEAIGGGYGLNVLYTMTEEQ